MARKYDKEGTPDADGLRDVFSRITERGQDRSEGRILVYRTFGVAADAPGLFQKWIAKLSGDPLAEAYDNWVYGVDLSARQEEKVGGPAEPWVAIPGKAGLQLNLVTGLARDKDKADVPGEARPLAARIIILNGARGQANAFGAAMPKQYEAGWAGLLATGAVTEKDGMLVAVPANGKGTPKR